MAMEWKIKNYYRLIITRQLVTIYKVVNKHKVNYIKIWLRCEKSMEKAKTENHYGGFLLTLRRKSLNRIELHNLRQTLIFRSNF